MFNWLKLKREQKQKKILYEKLQHIFYLLLILYQNTWDKKLVKQIVQELLSIDKENFLKNNDINKLVNKILKAEE